MVDICDGAIHRLKGEIATDHNPWYKDDAKIDDWRDIMYTEKGGAAAIAQKQAQMDGRRLPPGLMNTADAHNPVMDRLVAKSGSDAIKGIFLRFLTPEKSVSPQLLDEFRQYYGAYQTYVKDADNPANNVKVYKQFLSEWAKSRLEDAEGNMENPPHGINEANQAASHLFLKLVHNGWPEFDFELHDPDLQLGSPVETLSNNLVKAHVTYNPLIYLFHGAELPFRTIAQYPLESMKMLGDLAQNPKLLNPLHPETIPEAERAGIYSKRLPDRQDFTPYDHARAATGIPQCQTISENLAWLLHKRGVDLNEALQNVALQNADPLSTQFMFNMPDRGGAMSYIRYSMLMNGWYLNLYKRMASGILDRDPEQFMKAAGSLALYSAMKYAAFGTKAAIPAGGFIAEHVPGAEEKAEELDKAAGGNQFLNVTHLDVGGAESPIQPWAVPYYPLVMLANAAQTNARDFGKITRAFEGGDNATAGLTALHAILLDSSILWNAPGDIPGVGKYIPEAASQIQTPYSLTKMVGAYAKTVNEAGGQPLNIDRNQFGKNITESFLGPEAAKRSEETP